MSCGCNKKNNKPQKDSEISESKKKTILENVKLKILATPEEQERRWKICAGDEHTKKCEYFIKAETDALCRCSRCGCFLRAKTKLKKVKCPEDKW